MRRGDERKSNREEVRVKRLKEGRVEQREEIKLE